MPIGETLRPRIGRLEQFTETFRAPSEKREEAEKLLKELTKFQIVTPTLPLVSPQEGFVRYDYGLGVNADDRKHLSMRLWEMPLPSFRYANGNMRHMQSVEDKLAANQGLRVPSRKDPNIWNHTQCMYALAANIEIMDAIFTNYKKGKPSRRPTFFIENDVPHPNLQKAIRTDLVIVGSDNRFRLFEFGNSTGKPKKVVDQAGGIRQIYKNTTQQHLPPERVLPYVVRYDVHERNIELDIYPIDAENIPSLPRKGRPEQEDVVFAAAD